MWYLVMVEYLLKGAEAEAILPLFMYLKVIFRFPMLPEKFVENAKNKTSEEEDKNNEKKGECK